MNILNSSSYEFKKHFIGWYLSVTELRVLIPYETGINILIVQMNRSSGKLNYLSKSTEASNWQGQNLNPDLCHS